MLASIGAAAATGVGGNAQRRCGVWHNQLAAMRRASENRRWRQRRGYVAARISAWRHGIAGFTARISRQLARGVRGDIA
jgi:hypothetical protein